MIADLNETHLMRALHLVNPTCESYIQLITHFTEACQPGLLTTTETMNNPKVRNTSQRGCTVARISLQHGSASDDIKIVSFCTHVTCTSGTIQHFLLKCKINTFY